MSAKTSVPLQPSEGPPEEGCLTAAGSPARCTSDSASHKAGASTAWAARSGASGETGSWRTPGRQRRQHRKAGGPGKPCGRSVEACRGAGKRNLGEMVPAARLEHVMNMPAYKAFRDSRTRFPHVSTHRQTGIPRDWYPPSAARARLSRRRVSQLEIRYGVSVRISRCATMLRIRTATVIPKTRNT